VCCIGKEYESNETIQQHGLNECNLCPLLGHTLCVCEREREGESLDWNCFSRERVFLRGLRSVGCALEGPRAACFSVCLRDEAGTRY
jgi:hypothetical protein